MVRNAWFGILASVLVVGCNVSGDAKATSGAKLPDASASRDAADGAPLVSCARGISVVNSDYQSTNLSVLSPDGNVLSESIVSSGSASTGLTTPLSGDVVVPGTRPRSGKLVTIDRSSAVLTWIDVASGKVDTQLSVGTGFSANPHDYLEVSDTKGYVSRYETNTSPGKEPFDDGGDVLILNLEDHSITGNVPLAKPDDGEFLPRASRILLVGEEAWVMQERLDANFVPAGSSRIAGIDTKTDEITWTLDLPNAGNCGGMVLSPSSKSVIVSCSGGFDAAAKGRALVLVDATANPPKEIRRFPAATALDIPLAPSIAFASDTLVLGVGYGDNTIPKNDIVYSIDIDSGDVKKITEAGAGGAVLGDILCSPGCTDLCFLADAEVKPAGATTKGAIRVYDRTGTELSDKSFAVDPSLGLPPRAIGAL
jgi:hypothetical protein